MSWTKGFGEHVGFAGGKAKPDDAARRRSVPPNASVSSAGSTTPPPVARARRGATRRPTRRGRCSPRSARRGRRGQARRSPRCPTDSAISGTESSPSDAWPIFPGIWSAGIPAPSSSPAWRFRLPGAITVAVRSPTPARPVKVSRRAPRESAYSTHSRQIVAAAIPAAFRPCDSAAAAASAAAFFATPAISTPATSVVPLADQPRAVEDLAELGAQVVVRGSEDQGGHARRRLAGVRGSAERRDRARADPLAHVLARQLAEGLDEALGEQEHGCPASRPGRRARRRPRAARPRGRRGRRGRRRRARCRRARRIETFSGGGRPGR